MKKTLTPTLSLEGRGGSTEQYALSLPVDTVFSEDNFFVSGCNKDAYEWIKSWPHWPAHGLVIYGDRGCGKSHLGHLWATQSGASIHAADVPITGFDESSNWLIENLDALTDEKWLLHLLNHAKEIGRYVLLASKRPPAQLSLALPDLASRLAALPSIAIAPPDDTVLAAALRKQFADRQLKVEEDVTAYVVARMERSFAHVREVVATLDAQALAEQKNITVPFARRVLGY